MHLVCIDNEQQVTWEAAVNGSATLDDTENARPCAANTQRGQMPESEGCEDAVI